jgi:hypothetical protein
MKVYTDGLSAIISEIKSKTRARIYVMTPTVYDGDHSAPWSKTTRYNDVLDRYSDAAKQIAARENLPVIDLHSATMEALRKAKQQKSDYTFLHDGVHPEEDGQLVMAAEMLRAWGAKSAEAIRQANIQSGSARLTIAAPLPWPSPLPSETIQSVNPQITDLGKVRLKVIGLPSGSYDVQIDGSNAGRFTSDQLLAGIAVNSQKATDATRQVAALVRQRADIFFNRWRQIEARLVKEYISAPRAVAAIDVLVGEMTARARSLARPHNYDVVITRVEK